MSAESTSAAYISAPRSSGDAASGNLLANKAASVSAGEKSDGLMTLALPTSIASAIVSSRSTEGS